MGLGIDPNDVIVADLFSDDTDVKFGIAVVRTGEAIAFALEYSGHGANRRIALAWEGPVPESDRWTYESQISLGTRLLRTPPANER